MAIANNDNVDDLFESAVRANNTFMTHDLVGYVSPRFKLQHDGRMLLLATKTNNKTLIGTLLDSDFCDAGPALSWAISNKRSALVSILAHHVDNATLQDALISAYQTDHMASLEALIELGTDVNARQGHLLVESIRKRNAMLVIRLLELGADPNIKNGAPLRLAMETNNARVAELLLNGGAMDTHCDSIQTDFSTRSIIERWRRRNRMLRLKYAIRDALSQDTFKWQPMARGRDNVPELVGQWHKMHELIKYLAPELWADAPPPSSRIGLCVALSKMSDAIRLPYEGLSGSDLMGNDLCSQPRWKIVHIYGRVYTVSELIHLLTNNSKGYLHCPYTRTRLATDFIRNRVALLQELVLPNSLLDSNLISLVRETPIFTKEMEMRRTLNNVLTGLSYVPSQELIIRASSATIDDMLINLYHLMSDSPALYRGVSLVRRNVIMNMDDILAKREAFINLLRDITATTDSNMGVRAETVSVLLRHYNVDGSARNDSQDTLAWILGLVEDTSSSDDDDDDQVSLNNITRREPEIIRLLGQTVRLSDIHNVNVSDDSD